MTATQNVGGGLGLNQHRTCFAEFSHTIELSIPIDLFASSEKEESKDEAFNEDAIRDWIWDHHQDKIRNAIRFKSMNEVSTFDEAKRRLFLLDKISHAQLQYLQKDKVRLSE